MYRNEIQLYYFIENIVKGGNHGLIKSTPTSISNINKALINSATLTSSASNIHKNDEVYCEKEYNVQEYDEQEYLELNQQKNDQETHHNECGSTTEGK